MLREPQGYPNGQHTAKEKPLLGSHQSPNPPLEAVTTHQPSGFSPFPSSTEQLFCPEYPLPHFKVYPLERRRHPSGGDGSSKDTVTQPTPSAPSVLHEKKAPAGNSPTAGALRTPEYFPSQKGF